MSWNQMQKRFKLYFNRTRSLSDATCHHHCTPRAQFGSRILCQRSGEFSNGQCLMVRNLLVGRGTFVTTAVVDRRFGDVRQRN